MSPQDGKFHESFSRGPGIEGGSNRSFGLLFAVVCGVLALAPLRHGGEAKRWLLLFTAALLALALVTPALLGPLNRVWTKFGMLLHRITTPVLLGIIFYLVVTPMAVVMRMRGRDALRRQPDRAARTYWIARRTPGSAPETMQRQF